MKTPTPVEWAFRRNNLNSVFRFSSFGSLKTMRLLRALVYWFE